MSANSTAAAQWQKLVDLFNAEKVTGRLPTVKDVRKSIHLWTGAIPAIGVQILKIVEEPSSNQTHNATITFQIVAAAQSLEAVVGSQRTPANLDDAMQQMQAIVDDGAGNGICPILRTRANYSLGGNVDMSDITDISFDWSVKPGDQAEVMAYAIITFVTQKAVSIHS